MSRHIITPIPITYIATPMAPQPFVPTIMVPCVMTPIKPSIGLICPGAPIKIRHIAPHPNGYIIAPRRLF